MRIKVWDEKEAKIQLSKRLRNCITHRSHFEYKWSENEQTVFTSGEYGPHDNGVSSNLSSTFSQGQEDADNSNVEANVSYAFRNLRFLHAQLSANPPSVIARPASPDPDDREKASAADKLVRHSIRVYNMQEHIDRASLNCLTYGSGFFKTIWDSSKGDILKFDKESGEILLSGDFNFSTPSPWDIFLDPDAECWEKVRFVFQKVIIPYEEAIFRWPDKEKELETARVEGARPSNYDTGYVSKINENKYDSVELFEYWERGLPTNAYNGRYCICLKDGTQVEPLRENPFRFISMEAVEIVKKTSRNVEEDLNNLPQIAELPFHMFTDIDMPNSVWGKSFLEYVAHLQDNINRLDMTTLDNVAAHGATKLVLPESAEVTDDSLNNSTWDVLKIKGSIGPHHIAPAQSMPDLHVLRDRFKNGLDDVCGINDSMFGTMKRETAGTALQYATNQGNLIRRRLFNKYVMFVESIYKGYLSLVRKHWTTDRTIRVLGQENILEATSIKGADITGGFDLQVEYGASLSLDPMTRREEIMTLMPLFEKAGTPPRVLMQLLRLNELDGMHDTLKLADDRQKEVFEIMIADKILIQPKEYQDHDNMIAYALRYFMTAEFNSLEEDTQDLCREHIRLRVQKSAEEKSSMQPAPTPAPAPMPPMAPPVPPLV
jgi:hypothetical protein